MKISNQNRSRINTSLNVCRIKCGGCYLGMIKNYGWLDLIYGTEVNANYEKQKIPYVLKTKVWETYFPDKYNGICYICEKENINARNFEAGHLGIDGGEHALNGRFVQIVIKVKE